MPKTVPSAARIVVIAGFALSCFGLLMFLWLAFGGSIPLGPKGYRFKANFADAATLADQSDVRIAGVSVGKVVLRERGEGNRTLATMEIDERYAPVRKDAKVLLRQKTLLGETYVEMSLGKKDSPPLPEGGTLPNSRVQEAVEFDELLTVFNQETRKDFQEWQASTADATRGRAVDLSDALGNLPGFVGNGQTLVEQLNANRDNLQAALRDTGVTFAALSRDAGALRQSIVRSNDVLQALSARRESLYETFQVFPTFLDESRRTMVRLETFAKDTEPLIRDLEPVLEDAQPALRSLAQLGPDAQRLFEDLPQLVTAGRDGLPALQRVLRGLTPTLEATGPFLQELNPILEFLELYQTTLSDFIEIGASALGIKVAKPPNQDKTNGHALPQVIVLGSQSIGAEPERSQDNRGNAYFGPNSQAFDRFGKGPEFLDPPSFDCRHVGGEQRPRENFPGCWLDRRIRFQGRLERFPRVMRAGPGGITVRTPDRPQEQGR
jgi:phospholipid/cholesterol/gamma-HCH transport system substrate-binding protein